MAWTLHFLEAEGSLKPWLNRLSAAARRTESRLQALLTPELQLPAADILIQRLPGRTIPQIGIAGHCFRRGCIVMTLDPDNANFAGSLEAGEFERQLIHEAHHSLRHDGAGYGQTLGEALVSEGLADHFEREANGGEGQIWNHALAPAQWPGLLKRAERMLWSLPYDHGFWFFGGKDVDAVPAWIGYALVGAYLDAEPGARPSRLAAMPARTIIETAWPGLLARYP